MLYNKLSIIFQLVGADEALANETAAAKKMS